MMKNTMVLAFVLISALAIGFVSTGPINGQLFREESESGLAPGSLGERLANLAGPLTGLAYAKGPGKPNPSSGKGKGRPTMPSMTEKQKSDIFKYIYENCYDYRTENFIDICNFVNIFDNSHNGGKLVV